MAKEVWKDISGYEGLYQISDFGNVKSITRMVKSNHGNFRLQREKLLKVRLNNKGYYTVILYKDSHPKTFFVHRLVAIAFIPNENDLPEVNHIDENKLNNYVENLEWVTHKENLNSGTVQKRIHKTDLLLRQRKLAAKNKKMRQSIMNN